MGVAAGAEAAEVAANTPPLPVLVAAGAWVETACAVLAGAAVDDGAGAAAAEEAAEELESLLEAPAYAAEVPSSVPIVALSQVEPAPAQPRSLLATSEE